MRVCLFEDHGVEFLQPLSATRPVFELLCGITSLSAKQLRFCGGGEVGVLIRPHLAGVYRLNHPDHAVNDLDWLRSGGALFVNGRWLPPQGELHADDSPHVALCGEDVAYALVPNGLLSSCCPNTIGDCLKRWKAALPHRAAEGKMIRYPWDLVQNNAEQMAHDFDRIDFDWIDILPEGVFVAGSYDQVAIAADARVEGFVAIDATDGPVIIDREAVVTAFSRLEGPCYIGPKTQIMGAKIRAGSTLGPQCRIGGEVEASIIHGYSNKYHEGFLGHSYVGEWVNLAAGTHNSDLRNDYGEVSVPIQQARVKSGLSKVGCFIGDHAKTGLATLINTGSNIGAFANVLPAGMLAPKHVPAFTNLWKGKLEENHNLDQLLTTAARVMQRRDCELTEAQTQLYRHLFDETAFLRRWVIQEAEKRKVSRSA